MKFNYIIPKDVNVDDYLGKFNTEEAIAEFEAQIDSVHEVCARTDLTMDVCVFTPTESSDPLFPQCNMGYDGRHFIAVNIGNGLKDIRHLLLATIFQINMVESGALVFLSEFGKDAVFNGQIFNTKDCIDRVDGLIEQYNNGEIDKREFAYRRIWTTPWALEAHREAAEFFPAKYVL